MICHKYYDGDYYEQSGTPTIETEEEKKEKEIKGLKDEIGRYEKKVEKLKKKLKMLGESN